MKALRWTWSSSTRKAASPRQGRMRRHCAWPCLAVSIVLVLVPAPWEVRAHFFRRLGCFLRREKGHGDVHTQTKFENELFSVGLQAGRAAVLLPCISGGPFECLRMVQPLTAACGCLTLAVILVLPRPDYAAACVLLPPPLPCCSTQQVMAPS